MTPVSRLLMLLAVGAALAIPAAAHRMPLAITTVEMTGTSVAVTHRLQHHDAVTLLSRLEGSEKPDPDD